jgi:fatty-acyl-CoA synthase
MSFIDTLRFGLWTGSVTLRALRDTGVAHNLTVAGISTAIKWLIQTRTFGPASALAVHAANHPDRECLIDRSRRLTYRDVVTEITQFTDGLAKRGVGCRTSIGVMLTNRAEFLITANAAARLGASMIPISPRCTTDEAAAILSHAGAHALIFDAHLAPIVVSLTARLPHLVLTIAAGDAPGFVSYADVIREGDRHAPPRRVTAVPTLVIYTSGTTGTPKGAARRTGLRVIGPTMAFVHALGFQSDDRYLAVCPLYHSSGIAFASFILLLGGTVVLMERFDAEDVLRVMARERITTAMMVPTMYRRLVDLPAERCVQYDVSSLRLLVSGGEPLPVPLQHAVVARFGPKLCNFYGSTETGWNTLARPDDLARKPGTIGTALAGNAIRLLDAAGRDVGIGAVGQLYVRSPSQMDGYHAHAAASHAALREGFFSVGDLAWRDAEGYFFLAGRTTDMVISGGVNIFPQDIEEMLLTHPDIREAAAVGVPDPAWGERVRAFVVPRTGVALHAESVTAFCTARLMGIKCPREVFVVDALPRTATGKVVKHALRGWDPQTPWPWTPTANADAERPGPRLHEGTARSVLDTPYP